ncbi:unnamed protein product [Phyllotreta striolata]|uniref:Non-homologous end-joining factor 1 n=1 Tax=Phyllotreta striolata TaxID=444603 RepID=A0A9N9XP21_PHYSR|nr:unnamed protein product [Phyllotreta striolata]
MWKTIILDNNVYLLKHKEIGNIYEISLTNLAQIWFCKVSGDVIYKIFQECNPIVEIKQDEALKQVFELLKDTDKSEIKISILDSSAKLCIASDLSECVDAKFKIKFEVELQKAEAELLREGLIVPLIQTVILLEKRQNMMKNLLIKKDRELEEYRIEKGTITRGDLTTEKFSSESLVSSSNNLLLNVLENVEEIIGKTYGKIEEKVTEVEVEPWNKVKRKRKVYSKETAAKAQYSIYNRKK